MRHELYRTKNDIEDWLKKYQVTDYELIEDSEYGYVVNVNSYVNLSNKNLTEIKVKFNIVTGYFFCNDNKLKSLKGSPKYIGKDYYCDSNKLTNLKYCPKTIKGYFNCSINEINTLEYFPKKVNKKCHVYNNPELGQLQSIQNFEELKKIHDFILLNKKIETEISIENNIKNVKIKL